MPSVWSSERFALRLAALQVLDLAVNLAFPDRFGDAHYETAATSMLPPNPPDDVAARLDLVMTEFLRLVLETESQQRTMLRLSLDADSNERSELPLRQGRAIAWIEEALAPLRPAMSDRDVRRLAVAIRSATGIESLAWLTDVAGLGREEAAELMRGTAQALLDAARRAAGV